MKYRAVVTALLLAGSSLLGSASPGLANRTTAAPDVADPLWLDSVERQSAQLRDIQGVLSLLKDRRRDDAKRALATILTRRPDDGIALEIAGMLLLEEGQFAPAEAAFRRSLAATRGNARLHAKLAVAMLLGGKRADGEAQLKRALQADPNEALALRYAGWIESARGNGSLAAAHYERLLETAALRSAPLSDLHLDLAHVYNNLFRFDRALALLAGTAPPQAGPEMNARLTGRAQELRLIAYVETGAVAEGKKIIASLPAVSPESPPDRIFAEGTLARIERDYARAESLFRMIPETTPGLAARKYYGLGRLFRDRQDWDNATRALETAAEKAGEGELLFVLRELSAALTSTGRGARAIELLGAYADRRPEDVDVRYLGAEVAFQTGEVERARQLAGQIIELQPDWARGHYIAGLIEWKENRHEDAIRTLRKAAALDPRDGSIWIALARVQDEEGDFNGMVATLEEALRTLDGDPALQFELATAHQSRDDDKKANALYRAILKRYPNHIPAINALGLNLAASKATLEEARKLIMRAYELAPGDPAIRGSYGWLLFKSGQTEKALPFLEEAAKALPENGPALYHLAAAYFATGRAAEAGPLVQKAEDVGGVPGPEHHAVHDLIRKTRRTNPRTK